VIRSGVLLLANHTGWSAAETLGMRTSRFLWWIEGLNDGKSKA
jgi:hypothetical protein